MSSLRNYDTLVVHGGGLTPEEALTEKAAARMDTAIIGLNAGIAPNMVTSGGHSFTLSTPPSQSEAAVMKNYALDRGVTKPIHTEENSLETVGNALFTKTAIIMPNDWQSLGVVTSVSHLPRTLSIYEHVFGDDYKIEGIAAAEQIGPKEKVWEILGSIIVKEILRGTKKGDHEAIQERLFDLVPGYQDATLSRLATKSLCGLVHR